MTERPLEEATAGRVRKAEEGWRWPNEHEPTSKTDEEEGYIHTSAPLGIMKLRYLHFARNVGHSHGVAQGVHPNSRC